jgi:DNA gyrase subunit A
LDKTIALIRASASPSQARLSLVQELNLSEIQAGAILEMRLQRLTGLEHNKIIEEYHNVLAEIANLRSILGSEEKVRDIIRCEALELARAWAEPRRTEIVDNPEDIDLEDIIAEEEMAVTLTHSGYIKRAPISLYRAQRRGGKGKIGMTTKEEDFVSNLFIASTHSYLLIFTDRGRMYWVKVHELPQAGRATKGKAIVNLVNIQSDEAVASILPVREFSQGRYVVLATRQGRIKKIDLMSLSRPRAGGIITAGIGDDDRLVSARLTDGTMNIFLATALGKAIRFNEEQVRPMGRSAAGVRGIEVDESDRLVAMEAVAGSPTLLTVAENGYGKRTALDEYPLHNRGGKGVITMKTSERNGMVVAALVVEDQDELMLITSLGKIIRTKVSGIPVLGRNTQGVKLIDVAASETLVAVDRMAEPEEGYDDNEPEQGQLFSDSDNDDE